MKRLSLALVATLATLSGCGDRPVFGLARDAGVDAARDARALDTGPERDAALDSSTDASLDALDVGLPDVGLPDVGLPDGGLPDGGLTDGGLTDGGLPDGGRLDGGRLDGGRFDGGLTDAGLGDAGRTDGGRLDGGLVDVGLRDAPAPDVGLADAGASDGGRDAAADAATSDAGPDARTHLGPAPVILGSVSDLASAGAYVLIGKTGMTNVIGSMISGGHLGVSPASASSLTGFALILDSSGEFSSSVSVVPPARVYAADYATPTPVNLTSAIASMENAYTDAATRSGPDFLNLASGHLGGLALVPGLYTFGTSVDITAGITLVGGANDVWIFQITNDLALSSATSMVLAGGARAENIFWQVAGEVTMGTGSHFEGIILCSTGITMQTGASLHGRALAQSLVALDNNNITAP